MDKHRYTLTVPQLTNDDKPLAHVHKNLSDRLAAMFGGFTRHDALGAWRGGSTRATRTSLFTSSIPTASMHPFRPLWSLKLSAWPAQQAKAVDCLGAVDPLDVLSGPIERALYRNIISDIDAVTVDVWITRAATRGALEQPRQHNTDIAAAVRRVARHAGLCPRDFQAAVWLTIRN